MGPGDSKLLCGPTTIIKGKERCDRKGRKRARKVQSCYMGSRISVITGIQLF